MKSVLIVCNLFSDGWDVLVVLFFQIHGILWYSVFRATQKEQSCIDIARYSSRSYAILCMDGFEIRSRSVLIRPINLFWFLSNLLWRFLNLFSGGHSTFFALLNTFVHIVMYFYYMIAAMGPRYQKYIWWKKYLTTFQMVSLQSLCNVYLCAYVRAMTRLSLSIECV